MRCHFKDSNNHCWFYGHKGINCEYSGREWGCGPARHEKMQEQMIQNNESEVYERPDLTRFAIGLPRPSFIKEGSLLHVQSN